MPSSDASGEPRVTGAQMAPLQFFVRPLIHAAFLGIMGAFVLLGVAMEIFDDGSSRGAGAAVAGLVLFLTAILYLPLIWYQRVKLGPTGISVRAIGCTVATGWLNLERFTRRPSGASGLVTREPMTGSGVERLRRYRNLGTNGMPRYDDDERQWFLEGRYIPLQGFNHVIRSGALQHAIAAYVPGLEGLTADQSVATPAAAAARKLPRWFWPVMAALIAGTVALALFISPESQARAEWIIALLFCGLGSLRVAYSAITCWRGRLRVLAVLYAILAVMLALLALAALGSATGSDTRAASSVPTYCALAVAETRF